MRFVKLDLFILLLLDYLLSLSLVSKQNDSADVYSFIVLEIKVSHTTGVYPCTFQGYSSHLFKCRHKLHLSCAIFVLCEARISEL